MESTITKVKIMKIPTVRIEFKITCGWGDLIMELKEYKSYKNFFKFCSDYSIHPRDIKKVHHIMMSPKDYPTTEWEG